MDTRTTPLSRSRFLSERGNAAVYILALAVLWFVIFSLKDWIYSTKQARLQQEVKKQPRDPYETFYINPYGE